MPDTTGFPGCGCPCCYAAADEIERLRVLLRDLQDFSIMDPRLHTKDALIRREQELGERIVQALK